jgi:glycosyltransferase domain-containing protein
MRLFNNLTFIVNTKNRHEDLKKILKYYYNTKIKFLIYDASKKPIDFNLVTNSNIKYFHTPGLKGEDRIIRSLSHIKTKFVAFHNDDDFYLQSTLKIALHHLEKNPNISAVGGRHYSFRTINNNVYSEYLNFNSTKYKINDNLTTNLENYLNNSDNTLVSIVLRSSSLIKIEKLMKKYNLNKYFLREVFYALAIFTLGKFKTLNLPFFFRNENSYSIRFDDPLNNINDNFFYWYQSTDKKNVKKILQSFYRLGKLKIKREIYQKIVIRFFEKLNSTISFDPKKKLSYISTLKTKLLYFYKRNRIRSNKIYKNELKINFILCGINYRVDNSFVDDFKRIKRLMI